MRTNVSGHHRLSSSKCIIYLIKWNEKTSLDKIYQLNVQKLWYSLYDKVYCFVYLRKHTSQTPFNRWTLQDSTSFVSQRSPRTGQYFYFLAEIKTDWLKQWEGSSSSEAITQLLPSRKMEHPLEFWGMERLIRILEWL